MMQDIYANEVASWLSKGAELIDVREEHEFSSGHIAGSKNIPLSEFSAVAESISEPVVLVCAGGNRSRMAAEYLVQLGKKDVANLMGGVFGWQGSGKALVR